MGEIRNVLSALPTLSSTELRSVIAASQALLEKDYAKRGPTPKSVKPTKAAKSGPTKKQGNPTSEYANIDEYNSFKSAEKTLKAFLKEQQAENPSVKLSSFKEDSADLPSAVAGFFEARQCWFRKKESLKASLSQI
jgi:hypothetical protein